jgi:cell shape-determining protein MreC
MQRQRDFWPIFIVVIFLSILILVLSSFGKLKFLSSFLERQTSAIQMITFRIFQRMPFVSENEKIKKLEDEKLKLLGQLADFEKIKKENQALSDQFHTSYPTSYNLLKAQVISASTFIPGISVPNSIIIDKGLKNNLKVGYAIVIKNNLVGAIVKVSENISQVNLVNNPTFSLTAKTQNGAVGLVRGGENIILGNVLLSENIKKNESVLTKGDIDSSGIGVIPDLVIGKIISINKNPSELFQKAEVESAINFVNLTTVFVQMPIK